MTEDSTTSASRIFIKIVFQELAEQMGLRKLSERLHEPALAPFLQVRSYADKTRNIVNGFSIRH